MTSLSTTPPPVRPALTFQDSCAFLGLVFLLTLVVACAVRNKRQ